VLADGTDMLLINTADAVDTPGVVCLSIVGDLDAGTAVQLRAAFDRVLAQAPALLELDLAGVTCFSCAGVAALLAARRAVHGAIVIRATSHPVRRLLDILDLQPVFGRPSTGGPVRRP